MLALSMAIWLLASVTWTVKLEVPVAVGVPLRLPSALRLMPAGRLPPPTDQVNGAVTPEAVCVQPGGGAGKFRLGPAMMVMLTGSVSLRPLWSVTLTVKE